MTLQGYAAHFDRPNLNGERVISSSFDAALATYNQIGHYPFVNFNHDPTRIVGVITEMHTDEVGLYVTAEVDEALPWMQKLAPLIHNGKIDSYSTEGYIDNVSSNGNGLYTAGQFFITGVAIVPFPADPAATFTHNTRRRCYLGAEMPVKKENKTNNQIIIYL